MKITTRKIAAMAGVSPATVSRYLNASEDVSDALKEKIDAALDQLGAAYPSCKEKRPIVMVLLTHLRFTFFSCALQELLKQEEEGKYTLILLQYDSKAPEVIRNFVTRMKPIGAIYFEEEIDDSVLGYLQHAGVRSVMCGGVALGKKSDMVHVNDIMAAYEGTRYLLGLGHKKILFLSDDISKIGAGFQRIAGCRKAMEEAGLSLPEESIVCCSLTYEAGYCMMNRILSQKRDFTAVFAFSDELAAGAMMALYDAGIRVPQQISVLGYDDLPIAQHVRPQLSTIHQPIDGFAKKALEALERPIQEPFSEILLQYSVVERSSCCRPL